MMRALLILVVLSLACSTVSAQVQPPPGKTWSEANGGPMRSPWPVKRLPPVSKPAVKGATKKAPIKPSRRQMVLRNEAQKEAKLRVHPKQRGGLQDLLNDEVQESAATSQAVSAEPTSEQIASAIGLNVATGQQDNAAKRSLDLEIDTWAGYLQKHGDIKVGPSLVLARRHLGDKGQRQLKANLDVGDNFVGLSANYVLAPVVCPAIGVGYGYQTDRSDWTIYGSARFKIW